MVLVVLRKIFQEKDDVVCCCRCYQYENEREPCRDVLFFYKVQDMYDTGVMVDDLRELLEQVYHIKYFY